MVQGNNVNPSKMSGGHTFKAKNAPITSSQKSQMMSDKISKDIGKSSSDLASIDKAITSNTKLLQAAQKHLVETKKTLDDATAALAHGGSDYGKSEFDGSDDLVELYHKYNEAQNTVLELDSKRQDLVKRYSDVKRKIQQLQEKLAKEKAKEQAEQRAIDDNASRISTARSHDVSVKSEQGKSALQEKYAKTETQKARDARKLERDNAEKVIREKSLNPSKERMIKAKNGTKNRYKSKLSNSGKNTKNIYKVKTGNIGKKGVSATKGKEALAKKMVAEKTATTKAVSKGVSGIASKVASGIGSAVKSIITAIGEAIAPIIPYILVALAVIAVFVLVIVIIVVFLVNVEPLRAEYTLKEAVYLQEQTYHAQIVGHINEFFYDNDAISEDDITYTGNYLDWKQILCYWYCLGCQRASDGTMEFAYYGIDPDSTSVRDLVRDYVLSEDEMNMITESYSSLNTIIVYPNDYTRRHNYRYTSQADMQAKIAECEANGEAYTVVNDVVLSVMENHKNAVVNIEHTDVVEVASGLGEDFLAHVNACLDAVNNDNRSLEPTFYDMWEAVKELTAVDENTRDMILREAYAMWIMSGAACNDSWVPNEARNQFGVDAPLECTIYREYNGNVAPFTFIYQNTEGNSTDSVTNALPWLNSGSIQHEDDVPVFLNPDFSGNANIILAYCNQGVGHLGVGDFWDTDDNDDATFWSNYDTTKPVSVDCENMNWSYYCYHVVSPASYPPNASQTYDTPDWCAAFVNSLGYAFTPGGCFFTERYYFIDSAHPSWTNYIPDEDQPWLQSQIEIENALAGFASIHDFGSWCVQVQAVYVACRDTLTNVGLASFVDSLHLSAHTNYYRLNLTTTFSTLPVGLYDETYSGEGYAPSAPDNTDGYAPDPDEFSDWMGVDLSDVVRFETREMYGQEASIGHRYGWYSPNFDFQTSMGDYSSHNRSELFCDVASLGGTINQVLQNAGGAGFIGCTIDLLGDTILGMLHDLGTADGYAAVMPTYVDEFQNTYFSIFGEIREEPQHFFGPWTHCDYILSNGLNTEGIEVYGNHGGGCISMELYTPCAGDIVIFNYDDADGIRDDEMDHTGIIVYTTEGSNRVTIINGNAGNAIYMGTVDITDGDVYAIIHLPYGA